MSLKKDYLILHLVALYATIQIHEAPNRNQSLLNRSPAAGKTTLHIGLLFNCHRRGKGDVSIANRVHRISRPSPARKAARRVLRTTSLKIFSIGS